MDAMDQMIIAMSGKKSERGAMEGDGVLLTTMMMMTLMMMTLMMGSKNDLGEGRVNQDLLKLR